MSKNIILSLIFISLCFTATAAKKISTFAHPLTGTVYTNAHLRLITSTVDEEANVALFRFDIYASKALYQAGKQPVWSGYVPVDKTNYTAVINRNMKLKDIAYEQAALFLKVKLDAGGEALVLSGSTED